MKRQMKIAAVVSATALLAIGASFTSMAAAKNGSWKNEDGVWYCYDKDGDVYENEFCLDGSEEFYVGDDGAIVYSEWAEIDGDIYYINSEGKAAKNQWKKLVPHNDEDAEAEWYYFAANGKMAKSKKLVIEGSTYYFDADGSVLYGWVDADSFTNASTMTWTDASGNAKAAVYTDENTGARIAKDWVNTYEPGLDDDAKEDADTYDYYITSKSKAQTGIAKNIEGETFFFAADGKQLKGWITTTGANGALAEIDFENVTTTLDDLNRAGRPVYFGCAVDGHAKKDKWIYEWANTAYYDADVDTSKKHFWVEKNGQVYIPTTSSATATASNVVKFLDAEALTLTDKTAAADCANLTFKKIANKTYAFNQNGEMVTGMWRIGSADIYNFGTDGAMVTGSVNVTDEYGMDGKLLFSTASEDKGVGVTGAKNGKLYYEGLLVTAKDAKYQVITHIDADDNGTPEKYIVNKSGSIQTTKKVYKDGDDVIVDASGTGVSFVTTTGATKGAVSGI